MPMLSVAAVHVIRTSVGGTSGQWRSLTPVGVLGATSSKATVTATRGARVDVLPAASCADTVYSYCPLSATVVSLKDWAVPAMRAIRVYVAAGVCTGRRNTR